MNLSKPLRWEWHHQHLPLCSILALFVLSLSHSWRKAKLLWVFFEFSPLLLIKVIGPTAGSGGSCLRWSPKFTRSTGCFVQFCVIAWTSWTKMKKLPQTWCVRSSIAARASPLLTSAQSFGRGISSRAVAREVPEAICSSRWIGLMRKRRMEKGRRRPSRQGPGKEGARACQKSPRSSRVPRGERREGRQGNSRREGCWNQESLNKENELKSHENGGLKKFNNASEKLRRFLYFGSFSLLDTWIPKRHYYFGFKMPEASC